MTTTTPKNHRQQFSMADIAHKAVTRRRALARGTIHLGEAAFTALSKGEIPKGDPLGMAEIAGIIGAKLTPQLLPLCHPISLSRAAISMELDAAAHAVNVYCLCEISERTGVEMEALTGASVALLTIWDLCKPLNAALEISATSLLYKSGGKQGEWVNPAGLNNTAKEILAGA